MGGGTSVCAIVSTEPNHLEKDRSDDFIGQAVKRVVDSDFDIHQAAKSFMSF